MIRRVLSAISDRLPARIINGDNGEPYLERYFVARAFGCEMYLHRFVGSDPDRGYHNHPWRWAASVVLSGGYWELLFRAGHRMSDNSPWCFQVLNGAARWRKPFRMVRFDHNHLHRVVLEPKSECWTLFVTGPRISEATGAWGFMRQMVMSCNAVIWVFEPYTKSPASDWWKTAPKGRELRGG